MNIFDITIPLTLELDLTGFRPKKADSWSGVAVWKILGRSTNKLSARG